MSPRHQVPLACRVALAIAAVGLQHDPPGYAAEGLSVEEARIAAKAKSLREEAERLLERVVTIPSATQNLSGVRAVGQVFLDEFKQLGFKTRWEEMPAAMKRAGHLIAEREGDRGPRILLIGHLDTVLEGKPFQRRDRRATGNGTSDMKGGDVVILAALKALHGVGRLEGARVTVIMTGDEEAAGEPIVISRASLLELGRRSDIALAFEAAIKDTATVARRGVSTWSLAVSSPTGHSAGIFGERLGPGAIFETARILDEFRRELAPERGLTFNPSLLLGGTNVQHAEGASEGNAQGKDNVVAGTTITQGDLRFLSNAQRDAARAAMRSIVARNLPKTSARISFRDEYPAMAPTPENYALLKVLDRTSRDLELGAVRALDPEEWVDLDSLVPQIERAALLIDRLSRTPSPGKAGPGSSP
jgi:glutamate carboxypeptidase